MSGQSHGHGEHDPTAQAARGGEPPSDQPERRGPGVKMTKLVE